MARPYYTLATLEDGRWCPQFGDYDRDTVREEFDEMRANGWRRSFLLIIKTTSARQTAINAALAKLNAEA